MADGVVGMIADKCAWCVSHGYTPGQPLTAEGVPVEHPLVLALPEVPKGAIALIAEDDGTVRFVPAARDEYDTSWRNEADDSVWDLVFILQTYGSVTVMMREPRIWPQIDQDELAGLPALVEVNGARFRRSGDASYIHELTGGIWGWWGLRGHGDVREVLDA